MRRIPIANLILLLLPIAFASAQVPSSWDWRDVDGRDFVAPPRNIQQCSSGYISIPVSLVETRRVIAYYDIGVIARPIYYSRQYLLSCAGGYYGEFGCEGGNPGDALTWIRDTGIPVDHCYTYRAVDEPCPSDCPDAAIPITLHQLVDGVVQNWNFVDVQTLKEEIWQNGPIVAAFDLYLDFYDYDQGIYSHVYGIPMGSHTVLVVGWGSDGGTPYWICQNCWGEHWGEDGYFRMAMTWDQAACEFGKWTWWASMDVWASDVPEGIGRLTMLEQNAPNPFNPTTRIRYRPQVDGPARLTVHDLAGRTIAVLSEGIHEADRAYTTDWNGRDQYGAEVAAGVYLYRLECNGLTETKRMVLLR